MTPVPPPPERLHVVVGVFPGQHEAVVGAAARLARQFDAEVVCAWVDPSRYPVARQSDGRVVAAPIDPDSGGETVQEFDPALRDRLARVLDAAPVAWSVRALAGSPAKELARLADDLEAALIVVGTRDPGLAASVREFFSGSVAAQLAHRQHRPVVVIPLDPVGVVADLPWEGRP